MNSTRTPHSFHPNGLNVAMSDRAVRILIQAFLVKIMAVDGVPLGTVTLRFVWQNEIPPQVGSVHAELLSKYGIDTEGYVFELTRGDKNFRIDLE